MKMMVNGGRDTNFQNRLRCLMWGVLKMECVVGGGRSGF